MDLRELIGIALIVMVAFGSLSMLWHLRLQRKRREAANR